ncbi:MAG: fumarate reductase iron-sulfur subunit [Candidatus Latescibacterota bacterium]|nr:MAG: fumarate reductase iron-sulfur subunit [Candidatus Latescibacterota bacterium]
MIQAKDGRTLKFHIFRYNPQLEGDEPKMVTYEVKEAPGMTVFIALNEIREQQDRSLQYDFVCRAGICGSCGMIINGKPDLACRTLTSKFKNGEITLLPLPGFDLIGDLSVNTGTFNRAMSERVGTWIHDEQAAEKSLDELEERMDPDLADEIYELDRCIECGCCIAACATKRMRDDFLGAMGFMKVARFHMDSRDKRSDAAWYEIIGNDEGVFGCMTLLGCEDNCPKDLPHQTKIAFLRRKMVGVKV